MRLVADRFLVNDREAVIDLASGARVELIVSSAGSAPEQARWAVRCERFAQVRHRSIAPLVDYGMLGADCRFEAWRCGVRVGTRSSEARRAVRLATEHLNGRGLSVGRIGAGSVRVCGRVAVLPDADAGYEVPPAPAGTSAGVTDIDALGLCLLVGEGVAAVAEVFADASRSQPRVVGLYGAPDAGIGACLRQIARAARLHGFVPLTTALAGLDGERALAGRSIALLCHGDHADGWRRLVHWSVRTGRPPVLIVAGEHAVPWVHTVRLSRFSRERLIDAVRPSTMPARLRRRVEAAAGRSQGWPGRFANLLWGESRVVRRGGALAPRAAERAPAYGAGVAGPDLASPNRPAPWPSRDELIVLRQRMAAAIDTLAQGRHAEGDRQLRQVVGGLARRHDWSHAAQGGLALGQSLLRRGCPAEARAVLTDAHAAAMQAGERADESRLLVAIAVAEGIVATDLLQLDAAETVLHAAVAAAKGLGDAAGLRGSTLALARCLFWRGRFDEGFGALADRRMDDSDGVDAVHVAAARSRLAVGQGEAAGARAYAVRAAQMAAATNDPSLVAVAAYASAFAHLAIGDCDAVERDVTTCVRASRAARRTLLGLRARLIEAEAARRSGRRAAAGAVVARIGGIARRQLPPIVRACHALLADLLTTKAAIQVVRRHVEATGLKALALWVPAAADADVGLRSVNDIVDILGCCHAAEDDEAVLTTLCARLRTRLQAAGVAFFAAERDAAVPVACYGGRIDAAFGRRLFAAGQPVAPHQADERIEGGVAVRYAGRTVGALAARWLLGSAVDAPVSVVLLTTAAAAAGPALAGLTSRRAAAPGNSSSDLLGASALMDELRRAVDRAAAAPFAALIEGESGSGKELVARALHRKSARRDRPFCTLNCAALPDDLVESELFGHARGAFTGAVVERPGVFEEADTGTLFLDEVGELSPRAQAKVLRTIQEGELRRVGENIARRIDVRIVTATNRDLRHEVAAGRFRLDLLYRLDVLRIAVPPLRDRRDDVPVMAEHFWRESTARVGSRASLSASTVAALARYDWPGNVRELQNVLASLAVRSPRRGVVSPSALPAQFDGARADHSWRLDEARRTFETRFIRAALARSGGHRTRAAEELGVTRQGLTKLMVRLGIAETS
ncbi:MAG: hypothetical protein GEU82_08790 [Luteitalea sp.]|nr:hypothetical protein [Luteitalea sp.]